MRHDGSDAPAWFCCGLLLFATVASRPVEPVRDLPPLDLAAAAGRGSIDPDALAPRDLRRLPGIGPARALVIARARWEGLRGGPRAWTSLPGIGPATAASASAALSGAALSGAAMEPSSEHAYTRRESP